MRLFGSRAQKIQEIQIQDVTYEVGIAQINIDLPKNEALQGAGVESDPVRIRLKFPHCEQEKPLRQQIKNAKAIFGVIEKKLEDLGYNVVKGAKHLELESADLIVNTPTIFEARAGTKIPFQVSAPTYFITAKSRKDKNEILSDTQKIITEIATQADQILSGEYEKKEPWDKGLIPVAPKPDFKDEKRLTSLRQMIVPIINHALSDTTDYQQVAIINYIEKVCQKKKVEFKREETTARVAALFSEKRDAQFAWKLTDLVIEFAVPSLRHLL